VRPFSPTKARRAGLKAPVPELEAVLGEPSCEREWFADEPELRNAEQLGSAEVALPAVVIETTVRDQLHDVRGGVVEVARACLPVIEFEDHLACLRVGEQLHAFPRPRERRVEAITRNEERDVVERCPGARRELEARSAEALAVEVLERRHRPLSRTQPDLEEFH